MMILINSNFRNDNKLQKGKKSNRTEIIIFFIRVVEINF